MTAKEAAALILYKKMCELDVTNEEVKEFSSNYQRGHFNDKKIIDTRRHFEDLWERALKPVYSYIEKRRLEDTADAIWTKNEYERSNKPEPEPKYNIDWSAL